MSTIRRYLAGALAGLAAAGLASLAGVQPAAAAVRHHHHHHSHATRDHHRSHHEAHVQRHLDRLHHAARHPVDHSHRLRHHPAHGPVHVTIHDHGRLSHRDALAARRAAYRASLHHRRVRHAVVVAPGHTHVVVAVPRRTRLCQQVMIHGHWVEKCR